MIRRSAGLYVVVVALFVLMVAPQAGASEISLADWWDGGHSTTFDNVWSWVDYDIWHDGDTYQQMAVEMAGYSSTNSFGWFDLSYAGSSYALNSNGYTEIFAGGVSGGGTPVTVTIPSSTLFDWYMNSPDAGDSGMTWHSNEYMESDPDPYFHHAWVFQSTDSAWIDQHDDPETDTDYSQAYMIAWEDLPQYATWYPPDYGDSGAWHTNGEPDNNDMVVMFWTQESMTGNPVPEPGSLVLLSMALCGVVGIHRKRRRM